MVLSSSSTHDDDGDEKVISGNPKKKGEHDRIPRESEKTILFRKPGDEARDDEESLNLHDSGHIGKTVRTRNNERGNDDRGRSWHSRLCATWTYEMGDKKWKNSV